MTPFDSPSAESKNQAQENRIIEMGKDLESQLRRQDKMTDQKFKVAHDVMANTNDQLLQLCFQLLPDAACLTIKNAHWTYQDLIHAIR